MGRFLFHQHHHKKTDEVLPNIATSSTPSLKNNGDNKDNNNDKTRPEEGAMGAAPSSTSCIDGNEQVKQNGVFLPVNEGEGGAAAALLVTTTVSEDHSTTQCELESNNPSPPSPDGARNPTTSPSLFQHEQEAQQEQQEQQQQSSLRVPETTSPKTKQQRRHHRWSRHSEGPPADGGGAGGAGGVTDGEGTDAATDAAGAPPARRHATWHGDYSRSSNSISTRQGRRRRRKSRNGSHNSSAAAAVSHHHHHHFHALRVSRLTAFMAHMTSSSSKGTNKVMRKTSRAISKFFTRFEEFLFPPSALTQEYNHHTRNHHPRHHCAPKVRGGVLLDGCDTPEEHYRRVREMTTSLKDLHGADGLALVGLEYRLVHCPAHLTPQEQEEQLLSSSLLLEQGENGADGEEHAHEHEVQEYHIPINSNNNNNNNNSDKDSMSASIMTSHDDQQSYVNSNSNNNMMLPHVSSMPDLQGTDLTSSRGGGRMTSVKSCQSLVSLATTCNTASGLDASHPPLMPMEDSEHCHLCCHRLVHINSNTPIDTTNRKKFIADGDMYEAMARCCQEYAQHVMCEEGQLEWVTIEQSSHEQQQDKQQDPRSSSTTTMSTRPAREPIRALVNSNHPLIQTTPLDSTNSPNGESSSEEQPKVLQGKEPHRFERRRPTILICTGKGKVRAGIFSRQHLMCTSLESATALPIVREAKSRHLNMVIPDPNVHGDAYGYDTFSKTMSKLFSYWEDKEAQPEEDDNNNVETNGQDENVAGHIPPLQSRDLYVLSHSASGAQIARYLLDKADAYLPHIRAIAFTDSTHNIQWCKNNSATTSTKQSDVSASSKSDNGQELCQLLESPQCVYFRCANERRDGSRWYLHAAGDAVKTDSFWTHRFGEIQTYWAGTNEHSLTNWYAHAKIWEHFDQYLHALPTGTAEAAAPQEPSPLFSFGNASDDFVDEDADRYSNDFELDLDDEQEGDTELGFDRKLPCTAPMTV